MLNCKQASELLSQQMEQKLPLGKRLSLQLHLIMCHGCSNFISQLRFLRTIVHHHRDCPQCDSLHLSEEAKQRISQALKDAQARKEEGI